MVHFNLLQGLFFGFGPHLHWNGAYHEIRITQRNDMFVIILNASLNLYMPIFDVLKINYRY